MATRRRGLYMLSLLFILCNAYGWIGVNWLAKSKVKHAIKELDIPFELVDGIPRVTAWGKERVWVENHTGILEYTQKRARFKTRRGEITIKGAGFVMEYSGAGSACITGEILSIEIAEVDLDAI